MQVNYKTISSLEFDVLSGTYKNVEKQVEDSSGSFSGLLELGSSNNTDDPSSLSGKNYVSELSSSMASLGFGGSNSSQVSFSNDFSTSLQAYKFRQDEQNILNKKEQENLSNSQKSALDEILSQVS
ncbi:hypothetical protein [uncultured Campylobacter sp.]|uniref:hypothetical protein n=1 Tax=uncultured Campylobacter sp. TaxID=218934 RepID=UPI002603FFB8|nr:hypothetical protein [uncultured Campylobacter sp.]